MERNGDALKGACYFSAVIHSYRMLRSLLTLLVLSIGQAQAQQAVVPAGGEATGTGGTVSYTTGQVTSATVSSSNGSVAQGVQQPYEVIATSLVQESNGQLLATAFPNPASSFINIHLQSMVDQGNYRLMDALGQLVLQGRFGGTDDTLDLASLPAASYHLVLFTGAKPIGTFTVIKH